MDAPPARPDLYDLSLAQLTDLLAGWGEPAFRARQLYRQLYVHLAADFASMTDLSKALRERLAAETRIGSLERTKLLQGDDGMTRKALFKLPDGSPVESVLMVYPDRATVCVSSQSGCPMACVFCATGKLGHLHDLTAGPDHRAGPVGRPRAGPSGIRHSALEIYPTSSSWAWASRSTTTNWWASVERLHDPKGFNLGARSFTVSTVGLIPGIRRLAEASLPINLAISLHAADDELRTDMMPVNKRYPIADLIDAVRDYTEKTSRRVSFEYVLLKEKNDFPEQAQRLADLLKGGPGGKHHLLCHVNLIPWNPVPGTPLGRSDRARVDAFRDVLDRDGIPCSVRMERGTAIAAACGQLAGEMEEKGET
jgi:23S rRNA (adenine2503-C2)-methyltransferase